jgi:hypothetical protein
MGNIVVRKKKTPWQNKETDFGGKDKLKILDTL